MLRSFIMSCLKVIGFVLFFCLTTGGILATAAPIVDLYRGYSSGQEIEYRLAAQYVFRFFVACAAFGTLIWMLLRQQMECRMAEKLARVLILLKNTEAESGSPAAQAAALIRTILTDMIGAKTVGRMESVVRVLVKKPSSNGQNSPP